MPPLYPSLDPCQQKLCYEGVIMTILAPLSSVDPIWVVGVKVYAHGQRLKVLRMRADKDACISPVSAVVSIADFSTPRLKPVCGQEVAVLLLCDSICVHVFYVCMSCAVAKDIKTLHNRTHMSRIYVILFYLRIYPRVLSANVCVKGEVIPSDPRGLVNNVV